MPPRTSPRKKAAAAAPAQDKATNGAAVPKPTKPKTRTKAAPAAAAAATTKKRKAAAAVKDDETTDAEQDHECDSHGEEEEEEEAKKPAPKKRKTTASKKGNKDEASMAPLAERTAVSALKKAMYIGAHVSAAGGMSHHPIISAFLKLTSPPPPKGVQNAITNTVHIGGNSLALFLKSQRKWASPPLDPTARDAFHALAKDHAYDPGLHVLPHGSYLVNLAQADAAKADQAYGNFLDDLQRCDSLGIRLYNFHPGSTGGDAMAAATGRIAAQLNKAHRATAAVVTVVENMCGHGNIIGGRFEDLRDIIQGVDDKTRVGVCLDTCHAFAAGYDLRTPEAFAATMAEFDKIVGLKYLKALHLNDSKAPLGSHRDLHANIGTGFLGLRAFHNVMNYDGFQNLPMVLETPIDKKGLDGKTIEDKQVWATEIKLLEWLVVADVEGDEFKDKEKTLSAQGEGERKRIQQQVEVKAVKDAKKGTKKKKGKKAASDSEDDDE